MARQPSASGGPQVDYPCPGGLGLQRLEEVEGGLQLLGVESL